MNFLRAVFRSLGLALFFLLFTSCINMTKPQLKTSIVPSNTPKSEPLLVFTPTPKTMATILPTQTTHINITRTPVPILITPAKQTTSTPFWKKVTDWTSANQVQALLVDQNGTLWAGGPGGLVNWNPKTNQSTIYTFGSDSSNSEVVSLSQTPDGALWIGTFGNGLFRFDGNNWQSYTTKDGLPSDYIAQVGVFSDGDLWVNTSKYARDQFPLPKPALGTFDGQLWDTFAGGGFYRIKTAEDNSLWALGWGPDVREHWGNVFQFKDSKWEEVNVINGNDVLTAIGIAPDGEIWVAAETGIYHYNGNNWQKISPPWLGKTAASVSSLAISEDGTAWFGFSFMPPDFPMCGMRQEDIKEFGVYRYDGKDWTHFTSKDGLVDDKICDIKIDSNGNVWFGSYDKGISRFDGKTWNSYIISKTNNP
jgi:ligand-binding sensor domain-containing protein